MDFLKEKERIGGEKGGKLRSCPLVFPSCAAMARREEIGEKGEGKKNV